MSQIKKGLLVFGSLVLVIGFQNCAPGSIDAENSEADPIVTTFDDQKEADEMQNAMNDTLRGGTAGSGSAGFEVRNSNWNLVSYNCKFSVHVENSRGENLGIPTSINNRPGRQLAVAVVDITNVGSLEACAHQANMGQVVARVCRTEYSNQFGSRFLPFQGVIKISYNRFSIMRFEDSGSFEVEDYPFECRFF